MYGFINRVIELLVTRKFGDDIWRTIKEKAGVPIEQQYAIFQRYEDTESYDLVSAASEVLAVPAEKVLELFGEFFYEFCVEFGYDRILRSLGATPIEFVECLDALHDHLAHSYQGMNAPTFRCTREDDSDNPSSFFLHYHSHRLGLSPVVVGVVRRAIKGIFDIDVNLEVTEEGHKEPGEIKFLVTIVNHATEKPKNLGSSSSLNHNIHKQHFINDVTFADMFPFYIMFNRNMEVTQAGKAITRILASIKSEIFSDIFECVRPKIQLTFTNILAHINTVFVISEKSAQKMRKSLKLKGQMLFLWHSNTILFLASPSALDLEDLFNQGVYLADLPLHDASRDLIILSEDYNVQYALSQNLEVMTNSLKTKYLEVDAERGKTDRLIYSLMPPEIVDDLRHQRKVPSCRFPDVTILMTGIEGFSAYCQGHEPIEIIDVLNQCFSIFDNVLTDPLHANVYKVETVLDHYLAISGCPKPVPDSAKIIVELAFDLSETCVKNHFPNNDELQITVGINSGEIVTGIIGNRMPRYCLFGDCINVSSRAQTNGRKGSINITQSTYN